MAIMGTRNDYIDAFAQSKTNLVLDVSGYFAYSPVVFADKPPSPEGTSK
jgi:hypothetical protein